MTQYSTSVPATITLLELTTAIQGEEALTGRFFSIAAGIPNIVVFEKLAFNQPRPKPDILFISAGQPIPGGRTVLWSGNVIIESKIQSIIACR